MALIDGSAGVDGRAKKAGLFSRRDSRTPGSLFEYRQRRARGFRLAPNIPTLPTSGYGVEIRDRVDRVEHAEALNLDAVGREEPLIV